MFFKIKRVFFQRSRLLVLRGFETTTSNIRTSSFRVLKRIESESVVELLESLEALELGLPLASAGLDLLVEFITLESGLDEVELMKGISLWIELKMDLLVFGGLQLSGVWGLGLRLEKGDACFDLRWLSLVV